MIVPESTNEPTSGAHRVHWNVDPGRNGVERNRGRLVGGNRRNSSTRSGFAAAGLLVVVATACGPDPQKVEIGDDPNSATTVAQPDGTGTATDQPADTSTPQPTDAAADAANVARPLVPRVPTVRAPDVSSLTQARDRVAESLGE